jgi:hypothetical protein
MAGAPLASTAWSSPSVQLDRNRAGDLVRGHGVGREDGPVDEDYVMSEHAQQQCGGRAGGSSRSFLAGLIETGVLAGQAWC